MTLHTLWICKAASWGRALGLAETCTSEAGGTEARGMSVTPSQRATQDGTQRVPRPGTAL